MDHKLDPELFQPDQLARWRSMLPDDVRSVMGDKPPQKVANIDTFCQSLSALPEDDLPDFLEKNVSVLRALDRTGRLRLVAWLASNYYFDFPEVIVAILEREDDEGKGRESGSILGDDVHAITEAAISPRMARIMMERHGLDAVRSASLMMSSLPSDSIQKMK